MATLPLSSWGVNYHCGSYTVLWPTWHAYDVRLGESKLFYIDEGEIVIRIKGDEIICKKGDMVLIPAGTKHDFYLSEGGSAKKYWMHFSLDCAGASVFDRYKLPIRLSVCDEGIRALFADAVAPVSSESDALRQVGAICRLAAFYIDTCGTRCRTSEGDEIDEILRYIGDNLAVDFSLPCLSERVHLSPNYFVRKFRERMGISPMKYIALARLEKAKSLLSGTDMRIGEIMARVGLYDAAYFSRSFKALTGYSPRIFREISRSR